MAIINGVQCFILVLEFNLSVCPNCSPSQSYFVTLFNSLLSNCLLYRRSRLHGWYLCLSIYKTCMQCVLFSAVGTLFDLFRPLLHCLSHFRPLSAVEWETESPFCSQLPSSSKGLNVNANMLWLLPLQKYTKCIPSKAVRWWNDILIERISSLAMQCLVQTSEILYWSFPYSMGLPHIECRKLK